MLWKRGDRWYATIDGKRVSLWATDRREAERNLAEYLTEQRVKRRPTVTIGDLYEAYAKHKPRGERQQYLWANMLDEWGGCLPLHVTAQRCRAYHAARAQAASEGTIHAELRFLRTLLRFGLHHGHVEGTWELWLPRSPAPKDHRLTREQAARLLDAADQPHVRLFIILALTTAARRNAILELTWDRVDFDTGLVKLARPGHEGKGRATVPMNQTLRAALSAAFPARTTDYVIEWAGARVVNIERSFKRAATLAGLPWCTPHVLRHTAATWMVEAGESIEAVGQYLGHTDVRTTYRTYARFSPAYLKGAASALELPMAGPIKKIRGRA